MTKEVGDNLQRAICRNNSCFSRFETNQNELRTVSPVTFATRSLCNSITNALNSPERTPNATKSQYNVRVSKHTNGGESKSFLRYDAHFGTVLRRIVYAIVMGSHGHAMMTPQRIKTKPRIPIAMGSATQTPFSLAIAPTENGNTAERGE